MLTDEIMLIYNKQSSSLEETAGGEEVAMVVTDPTKTSNGEGNGGIATVVNSTDQPFNDSGSGNQNSVACQSTEYDDWSACSKTCGNGGIQFRYRIHSEGTVETRPCPSEVASSLPPCEEQCVPEFGNDYSTTVVASGFDSPRDLAFHPTPGVHLGPYSEGRTFHPDQGEELWVANGLNHSVSIVASLGTKHQTTISRRDRGYYHYMNNITALAFNSVRNSGRNPDQDSFNYFAVCNDNLNDYAGSKNPNLFMGPTLYDTDTVNKKGRKNTVNRIGEDCSDPADECFFLHADMLHEAPACIGITHDPEVETAYGTVYWAFDTTGDNSGGAGQLVRFDFSQPHGPGSMDHSIAVVRRYPEVKLYEDESNEHGHAGMIVHPTKRILYVANPGEGTVVAVHTDTGRYSRTARDEYPIFSNRLPSFEYSIYECVEQQEDFATGLDSPSGLALSLDGTRLFVAERGGRIVALEAETGVVLQSIDLSQFGYTSILGLAISPETGDLYFVDMDTNKVLKINAARITEGECTYQSLISAEFQTAFDTAQLRVDLECGKNLFSLARDYSCKVDGSIPNGTLFEQVHTNTGYASDNPDVQSMAGMDEAAALLANRTDCEYASELNLDALLLGGYYCHICLPQNHGSSCDAGGTCANVQWQGFTCDNEYYVDFDFNVNDPSLMISSLHHDRTYPKDGVLELSRGVTYRFTVRTGSGRPVSIVTPPNISPKASLMESPMKSRSSHGGAVSGPILLRVDDATPPCLHMTLAGTRPVTLMIKGADECPGSSVEPGDDMNGVPGVGAPEGEGSGAKCISFIRGYFALVFVCFVFTI
mmetsp:Transcript_16219/g.35289  ORF Transcript_16219/g.35289 Transcript_16219/m.35289 type:complete len:821 (+) Transcript_16219:836-3298(+)